MYFAYNRAFHPPWNFCDIDNHFHFFELKKVRLRQSHIPKGIHLINERSRTLVQNPCFQPLTTLSHLP